MPTDAYRALALQVVCRAVNALNRDEARAQMRAAIAAIDAQLRASIAFIGRDVKLVVLPEYFLTGFPMGESIETWADKACIAMNGAEYELLGKVAQASAVFLSGNAYELDPKFDQLYFQTSFIIAPSGDVILRYRRLNSMFAPTPHDVWERYLDAHGLDGVFPVARTDIGNLACIASEEILYPEMARCVMMNGAEVFLHSSSEVGSPLQTQKDVAKRARAIENMACVVSANTAGVVGAAMPAASADGGSQIVDFNGDVRAMAGAGESMVANAEIDLAALRRARRRVGMSNFIARQRLEAYAEMYRAHSFYPPNTLANKPAERAHFVKTQQEVIARLADEGVI